MSDPMIRVMERRPASSGFWVQDFRGGDLIYADAHLEAGSAMASAYPVMDRCDAYRVERAIDWILNAAAASRARVARAFRAIYPGSRVESEVLPSDWWGRQLGGVVGIDFSAYFGNNATNANNWSRGGLVIDTQSGTSRSITVSAFSGGYGEFQRGHGPGGGNAKVGNRDHDSSGGGSHGTTGGSGGENAIAPPSVPAISALNAVLTGKFTNWNLGMGGGGGGNRSGSNPTDRRGGSSGRGHVILSIEDIIDTSPPTVTLAASGQLPHVTGGGSGGGCYRISRRGYTLAAGVTINLAGHDPTSSSNTRRGGQGRFTTLTVDQPNIEGNISYGVRTHFQIYPSIPLGAVRVM